VSITCDQAQNPQEVLAAVALRDAITTAPFSVATVLFDRLSGVRAIPLRGAGRCAIAVVGHADRRNALVTELLTFMLAAAEKAGAGQPPGAERQLAPNAGRS
jgi:hypothetical protein